MNARRKQALHLAARSLIALVMLFGLVLGGVALLEPQPVFSQAQGFSLRLYGNGVNGIDRVEIPIDPAVPADIGMTHFTIEWWMKASLAENNSPGASCNTDAGWISGNILFDRDIFGGGDYGDFGISISGGKVAFGVSQGGGGNTLCGNSVVANGSWHHVAVTRNTDSGQLRIYVDGVLDVQGNGPAGNVSYRDGRPTSFSNDPYLVIGAEKHDYNVNQFPSYSGLVDEIRISNSLRYTANFTRPSAPFTTDANTVALYHLNEGPAGACTGNITDSSGASGGPSTGVCRYGGSPAGPVYVSDIPFGPQQNTPTSTITVTSTITTTPTRTVTVTTTSTRTVTATPTVTRTPIPPPGDERVYLPTIINSTEALVLGLLAIVVFSLAGSYGLRWLKTRRPHL